MGEEKSGREPRSAAAGDRGRSHRLCGIALGLLIDWFPVAASEEAKDIDTLWDVLVIVSVPIFVLVETVVLYSVWRFRMRPGEELKDGPPIHGNTRLEVIWTAIPAIILVALCSYAYVVLQRHRGGRGVEMKVRVVGEQFTWTFFYPGDGGKEIASSQLYLPEGKQVKFDIQSKDVLHDFWVPAFRQKIDAVPGITTQLPDQAGQDRHVPRRLRRAVRPRALGDAPERPRRLAGRLRQVAGGQEAAGGRRRRRGGRRQAAAAAARRPTARRSSRAAPSPPAAPATRSPTPAPTPPSARTSTSSSRARTPPSSSSRSRSRAPRSPRASRMGSCPRTTATPSSRRRSRR